MRLPFLALLADGPAHGYELRSAYQERCGALLPPMNAGQVYNTLGRLESSGLVAGEEVPQQGRPDRRVYRITDAGRDELKAWVARPVGATRFGDEFFFKLAFAGLGGLADPATLIDEREADCLQSLRDTDAVARSGDPGSPAALLAERAAVHLEAELRWLETCRERLASTPYSKTRRLVRPSSPGRPPVHALRGVAIDRGRGRVRDPDGPERLREVDAAAPARRPRRARRRHARGSKVAGSTRSARRRGPSSAARPSATSSSR